jgi:hypothetical protein
MECSNNNHSILTYQFNYDKCNNNILYYFSNMINKKTGLIFNCSHSNNYYIYQYENYMIIFNCSNEIWGLVTNNVIMIESKNLSDIIFKFLFDTNRLTMVIYDDPVMNDLTNLMMKSNLSEMEQ